jgi:ribonucleoside-diphosphate reductase beta chain
MAKIFENRIPYKPFEFPEYYLDGWLPQAQSFWLHTEIPMQSDLKDWNENLTEPEKNLVGNILLGFAQTECAVSDYWTTMVTGWFPKHEIRQMAMMFGSQETIHAVAYSYLNETLGLEDYEAFLHEPTIANKFEMLMSTEAPYTHEDLLDPDRKQARSDVATSLAIFSAFAEGVSLYSSFAVLYSFQMRNMLKGIGQQMKWSVRDESLHSRMGCRLFNHICEEYPELRETSKKSILEAAELIVKLEIDFIDKIFEMGDLENLAKNDLKNFIKKRTNEKLKELGYSDHFEYDENSADNLSWFDHLTGGHTHTDFFAIRPTDYAKAGEKDDWSNVW